MQIHSANPRDLLLTALLLAVAILGFPFAFECGAILVTASRTLREALARSRQAWAAAVVAILAILAISGDALRLVLHVNIFAMFSSEDFLASRQANMIERIALLLSFAWLLLFARLDPAAYRPGMPKVGLGPVRRIVAIVAAAVALAIKWNHFIAPISFLPHTTVSWAGFNVLDPDPTAWLMVPILAALAFGGGGALIFIVQAVKVALARMGGEDA